MNKFTEWVLRFAASKLDGKKAYIGAAGQALSGVGTVIAGVVGMIGTLYPDTNLPAMELDTAWAAIVGGIFMISSGWKSAGQRAATAKVEEKVGTIEAK